ncbi:MAG: glycosyltransferase [Fimbriimonadales bacterium]|nr:glycosyltransferase [Fimbriimonadales bacterium]MDW8052286.1 glycosyltransferase family 2 protein [Armatimonadota bacterium]
MRFLNLPNTLLLAEVQWVSYRVWLLVFAVLAIQLTILLSNLAYWRKRRLLAGNGALPTLSVLIPARNERTNLPALLESLAPQLTSGVECYVCDDHSEDGTTEWLACHAERLGVRWFRSAPRPEGWVGKNWACYQLATRAQGEWLVFLDADVRCAEGFLHALRAYLATTEAHLVSAIPSFVSNDWLSVLLKVMVPFSVFTLLPLPLAEHHPNPAFAFANGQLMAVRKRDYVRWLPHFFVRAAVLEDVAIAALVKRHRGIVRILDGRAWLHVQMYPTLRAAIDGFSKNAVAICRSVPTAIFVAVALGVVYLFPLLAWVWMPEARGQAGLALLASVLMFGLSARVVGLPFAFGFGYPISVVLALITLVRSIVWYQQGAVVWKGRAYRVGS